MSRRRSRRVLVPVLVAVVVGSLSAVAVPANADHTEPPGRVSVATVRTGMSAWSLVRMPIPAERLDPFAPGVRLFRFRTTASRLISCVLQPPERAVIEDDRPMAASATLEALQPGECFVWRDEVYIAAGDGSDPRHNGRVYTLLVPAPVAYLEQLPLHDVLAHHI